MKSLKFVLGRAGTGKSEYILSQAKLSAQLGKNAVIIVPEQYTHERETQMLAHTGYICESLNVTSFNRLAYKLISESGIKYRRTDSSGKAMLLSRAMSRCRSKMTYFKTAGENTGYINLFLDAVSEFKKGQVMPESLKVAAQEAKEPLLSAKLHDIAIIYDEYNKLISDNMRDSDDDITLMASLCFGNEYIKNSVIYIDEFFRFTQNEIFCIQSMLSAGADIVVSLCMPENATEDSIFAPVVKTKEILTKCAHLTGTNISLPVVMSENHRFASSELAFLENSMTNPYTQYSGAVDNIRLSVTKNLYDEVSLIAAKIKSLTKNGTRFRDIAVIAGDYESYKDIVTSVFALYDIPVFADTRKKFLDHPVVVYLFAVLDLIQGITTEKVCVYMKSGFADISPIEASKLENYALASAINFGDWLDDERFLKKSAGIFATEEEAGAEDKIQVEVKNRLLAPIISLKDKISQSKNVADRVDALSDFFEQTQLKEKIRAKSSEFASSGLLNLADEYTEVYNIIFETLETMKTCLGDEDTGLMVLREILSAGFSQKSIGIIPKVCDSVSFGDINRSVIKNPDYLFLLGVNEGNFPPIPSSGALFTDGERRILSDRGMSVAPDSKVLIESGDFSVYENVNIAKKSIFVSYSIDSDGTSLRPAGFIGKLRRTFPAMPVEFHLTEDELDAEISIASPASAYSYVLTHIKELDKNSLAKRLCDELCKNEDYKAKIERAINFSKYENTAGKLSKPSVSALYGTSLTGSVSRFERFSSCPFSFFIEYGLRARERKVLKIEAPDVGSLLHEVVEIFSKEVKRRNLSFKTITKAEQQQICDEIIEEMFGAMMIKKVFSKGRIDALKTRLKSLVAKSVWAICEHVARGEFEPYAFELSFDKNGDIKPVTVKLPTGEEITMIGRIDRVDTYSSEGKLYIKVIDYKSGNKAYSLADIFNMTTLQLSVYMIAVTENGKEIFGNEKPEFGGMFYFRLDDPIENGTPQREDANNEKALKAFKMSGLVSDNEDVVHAMDKNASGWSAIIPVYIKSDGSVSESQSKLANPERYEKLKRYVKNAVTEIGKEILSGNIDIHPVRNGDISPCSYCRYKAICGFDAEIHSCRRAKKFSSDDEIWNEMQ